MAVTTTSGVAPFNFAIKQGQDLTITMTWLQSDGVTPMNLTGFSMKLTIRSYVSSATSLLALLSTSSTGSRIVLGGTAGTISLIFAHADTAALTATGTPSNNVLGSGLPVSQLGVYDLQYTDASGNVNYLLEGTVSLDPQVTI